MDPDQAQHGINWTQVIIALMLHVAGVVTLVLTQRAQRQNIQKTVIDAKADVNSHVGECREELKQNTAITKYLPERIEDKMRNGLGDHIAEKTAEKMQPAINGAAEKIIEVAAVAAKKVEDVAAVQADKLMTASVNEMVAQKSSDAYTKGFDGGIQEGERRLLAKLIAEGKLPRDYHL